MAAIGLASVAVKVFANKSSTQENMKQKNIVIPIPAAIVGTNILKKNIEEFENSEVLSDTIKALGRSVVSKYETYANINNKTSSEVLTSVKDIEDENKLADTVASQIAINIQEKQKILEEIDLEKRLNMILSYIEGELSVLQVEKKIRRRVKNQMEKTQKEYYLNEQMKAIQKELEDGEGGASEDIAELTEKINKTKLSKEAKEKAYQDSLSTVSDDVVTEIETAAWVAYLNPKSFKLSAIAEVMAVP